MIARVTQRAVTPARARYLREYQRRWMAKRRAEFFAGKSCARCGSTRDLELDHIDWRSKWTHNIWSFRKIKRESELSKCQVLCRSCHKIKSGAEASEIKRKASDEAMVAALAEYGTIMGTARALGIDRHTLRRRLKLAGAYP